jgi:hypothetical protein
MQAPVPAKLARACSLGAHAASTDRGRPPPRTGRPCCGTTEGWPNKPSRSGPVPDTASVAATACRHRASFQSLPQSPTPSRPSSPPFANSCPLAEYAPSSTYAIDLKPLSRFAPARLPSERGRSPSAGAEKRFGPAPAPQPMGRTSKCPQGSMAHRCNMSRRALRLARGLLDRTGTERVWFGWLRRSKHVSNDIDSRSRAECARRLGV